MKVPYTDIQFNKAARSVDQVINKLSGDFIWSTSADKGFNAGYMASPGLQRIDPISNHFKESIVPIFPRWVISTGLKWKTLLSIHARYSGRSGRFTEI